MPHVRELTPTCSTWNTTAHVSNLLSPQEASKRYARALPEREASVLALVEAMLCAEAAREWQAADENRRRSKQKLRDVGGQVCAPADEREDGVLLVARKRVS
jgi:hypothetical protein